MQASRIHLFHDFGYVAMDILDVRSEDAGTYRVVARNSLGQDTASATMEVETRSGVDTTSMHRAGYDKAQRLEESKFQVGSGTNTFTCTNTPSLGPPRF